MKKIIAILLSAVMLLTAFSSLAENGQDDRTVDTVSSASINGNNNQQNGQENPAHRPQIVTGIMPALWRMHIVPKRPKIAGKIPHTRTCPSPQMRYFVLVSSSSPMGPRA